MQDSPNLQTLNDYVDGIVGFPFPSEKFSDGPDGIRLVRGDNVTSGHLRWGIKSKYWTEMKPDFKKFLLDDGDVVIGMDGSKVGKNYAQIDKKSLPLLLVQRVTRLRVKSDLLQDYLALIVSTKRFAKYIDSIQTGTSIPHISLDQIKNYSFSLPSLPEQEIVCNVLHSLIDKINLNKKINENLELLLDSIFKHWFLDFQFPDEHGKPYKDSGGKIKTSKMRKYPDGWSFETLENIADIHGGYSYSSSEKSVERTDKVFITLNNILEQARGFKTKYSWIESDRITEDDLVDEGDLILANTEQTKDGRLLGSPAIVVFPPNYSGSGVFSLDVSKITPFDESDKFYLYLLLKAKQRGIAGAYNSGTTIWHFDATLFKNTFFVLIPPIKLIADFNDVVSPFFERMMITHKEILHLQEIHDYLLPRFTSNSFQKGKLKQVMRKYV